MTNTKKYLLLAAAGPLMIVLAASITGVAAFAQSQLEKDKRVEEETLRAVGLSGPVTEKCFTSGSPAGSANDPAGLTFLKVCITNHGNISHFESPAGKRHLATREGYAVCSNEGSIVHAFDVGSAESGWGEPTVTQPNGPAKFPLIVKRTSLDNRVQLTQTFTMTPADQEVQIAMAVKNISTVTLNEVLISRSFDGDINSSSSDDVYDHSFNSAWGTHRPASANRTAEGLMLTVPRTPAIVADEGSIEPFADWNPNGAASSPQSGRGCNPAQVTPGPAEGDLVGRTLDLVGDLTPGQTKTITLRYVRF